MQCSACLLNVYVLHYYKKKFCPSLNQQQCVFHEDKVFPALGNTTWLKIACFAIILLITLVCWQRACIEYSLFTYLLQILRKPKTPLFKSLFSWLNSCKAEVLRANACSENWQVTKGPISHLISPHWVQDHTSLA